MTSRRLGIPSRHLDTRLCVQAPLHNSLEDNVVPRTFKSNRPLSVGSTLFKISSTGKGRQNVFIGPEHRQLKPSMPRRACAKAVDAALPLAFFSFVSCLSTNTRCNFGLPDRDLSECGPKQWRSIVTTTAVPAAHRWNALRFRKIHLQRLADSFRDAGSNLALPLFSPRSRTSLKRSPLSRWRPPRRSHSRL